MCFSPRNSNWSQSNQNKYEREKRSGTNQSKVFSDREVKPFLNNYFSEKSFWNEFLRNPQIPRISPISRTFSDSSAVTVTTWLFKQLKCDFFFDQGEHIYFVNKWKFFICTMSSPVTNLSIFSPHFDVISISEDLSPSPPLACGSIIEFFFAYSKQVVLMVV